MAENLTPITALSVAVKGICDVTKNMISIRKQNKLVSRAQLARLETYVNQVVNIERMNAYYELWSVAAKNLKESYEKIQGHENTPIGDLLMEALRKEAIAYDRILEDFIHLPNGRGPH